MSEERPRGLKNYAADDLTPIDGIGSGPSAGQVGDLLRNGGCPNERAFDRFLPYDLRIVSGQHWTPLLVAIRVASWLDSLGVRTVVDIGSGAGKFCVAAALAGLCEYTGVEQRPRLVEAARQLARRFGVDDRVRFVQKSLHQGAIPEADAYYLYNPFGENILGPNEHLDDEVELSNARYKRDISLMEGFLARARVGTYVIKYNGFGGQMPVTYKPICLDRELPNVLRLWQQTG